MNFLLIAVLAFLATYAYAGTIMKGNLNETTTSNCGGNCPGGNCPSCPCGSSPSYVNIDDWCSKYSWNKVMLFLILVSL